MNKYIAFCLLMFATLKYTSAQQPVSVTSPDKSIVASVISGEIGDIGCLISCQGKASVVIVNFGLTRDDGDFTANMHPLTPSPVEQVADRYRMIYAKRKDCYYQANKITLHYENLQRRKLDIVLQVSNDGVAFRYVFPDTSADVKTIKSENTTFAFRSETKAWLQPMQVAKTGFGQSNPAYEENYLQNVPVRTAAPTKAGWAYPALYNYKDVWVAITEAGMDGNYCATRLGANSSSGVYWVNFPSDKEVFTGQGNLPQSTLPFKSPWRVITIGSLKTLMESTLSTDVSNPNQLTDTSYIKPGKASWSWINSKDDFITYDEQKRYIDFAADMRWQYCLIDAGWDQKIGYEKIAELAAYAKSKKVGLLLWYNSAGDWNTVAYTPKNIINIPERRREEFKRLEKLGIKGVKIDFFGGDGRSMIQYYIDIMKDAAACHLMVNFHGATLPRGWARTYPNLVTTEAVKGFEMITFNQADADREANHCAMLPFTRNLFDPMDFTPMNLYKIDTKVVRKTTSAFELALSVVFLSGVQHYAESPQGMSHEPEYIKTFLRNLPDSWDDVKFIDGYPGKYLVIARRVNSRWYIAGINGENTDKTVTLNLSFLKNQNLKLITDGQEPLTFEQASMPVKSEVTVTMKPNGGFVAYTP